MKCKKDGTTLLAVLCEGCDGEGGEMRDKGEDIEGFHVSDDDFYWAECDDCVGRGVLPFCRKCAGDVYVDIVGVWDEEENE